MITSENEHLLKSEYMSRREEELPVLVWYFPKESVEIKKASFLDIILYSKKQIDYEDEKMNISSNYTDDYDWGIISIKAQD